MHAIPVLSLRIPIHFRALVNNAIKSPTLLAKTNTENSPTDLMIQHFDRHNLGH